MVGGETMFDKYTTEQLLEVCGYAYNVACLHYTKKDAGYSGALKVLMKIIDELMRRARNANAQ